MLVGSRTSLSIGEILKMLVDCITCLSIGDMLVDSRSSLSVGESDLLRIGVNGVASGALSSLTALSGSPDTEDGTETTGSASGTSETSGGVTSGSEVSDVSVSEVLVGVEGGAVAAEVPWGSGAGLVRVKLAPVTEAVSPGVGSLDITTSSGSTSGNVAEVGTGGISTQAVSEDLSVGGPGVGVAHQSRAR